MEFIKLPLIKLSHKSKNYLLMSSSNDDSKINISNMYIKKKFVDNNIIKKNVFEDNNNINNCNNNNIIDSNQKFKLSLKMKKSNNQNSFKKLIFNPKRSCDNFYKNNLLQSFEQFTSLNSLKYTINMNKDKERNEKKISNNLSQYNIGKDDYEEKKKKILNKEQKIKLKNAVVLKEIRTKTIFNNELIKSVLN